MTQQSAEEWLKDRLQAHGIDIYASGDQFASFRERLAHAVAMNRYGSVIAGRHNGKPETYEQFVERALGIKLKDVPRGASASQTKQSNLGA